MNKKGAAVVVLIGGVALVAGLAVSGSFDSVREPTHTPTAAPAPADHDPSPSPTASSPEPGPPTGTASIPVPDHATLATVTHVHDGDTLYVLPDGMRGRENELTVRLIGIDTPELRPDVECGAIEARDRLRDLVPDGSTVHIANDRDPTDRFGRALLYVWTSDGTLVNLALVAEGHAVAVRIGANDRYWPELTAAEDRAFDAGIGMWGACR